MTQIFDIATLSLRWRKFYQASRQPIDAASIAVFRIGLGCLIMYDALRKGPYFFASNDGKPLRFSYEGFEWVPSAGSWAPLCTDLWFISGLCVAIGLFYRPAILVATGLTIFGFLQGEEYYLNHYYLLILYCILMCMIPAGRAFAVDRLWPSQKAQAPVVHKMHLWMLKAQTEIVLLYAGLVKISSDLLNLEPLRSWLFRRHKDAIFEPLWQYNEFIAAANYGVIALHVLGAPLLLFRRTRFPVFLLYCAFHISNHYTFEIGIFPWMTIAASTLFFDPDWPRRLIWGEAAGSRTLVQGAGLYPRRWTPALMAFLLLWSTTQAFWPLRHLTYPGDVAWTYEGHRWSWRMKLVDRWSPGLRAMVHVPERNEILIPNLRSLMTHRQHRKAATRPRMARQIAPQVADKVRQRLKVSDVRVHLFMPVGYNNREATLLVDPAVDMVKAKDDATPPSWIIKDNDKPLRRIEDVTGGFEFPDEKQMAKVMGLPTPYDCRPISPRWRACATVALRQMPKPAKRINDGPVMSSTD